MVSHVTYFRWCYYIIHHVRCVHSVSSLVTGEPEGIKGGQLDIVSFVQMRMYG